MVKKVLMILLLMLMTISFISCSKKGAGNNTSNEEVSGDNTDETANTGYDGVGHIADGISENSLKAFYNCSIIDGTGANLISDGVILVNGDKIEAVGNSDAVAIPEGYEKIDLNGNTVLPGFINTHVHNAYDETNLKNWLNSGVTTVRDLMTDASVLKDTLSQRDAFNQRFDVARIVSASPGLTVPSGYGNSYYTTADEAAALTKEYAEMGCDLIKFTMEDYEMARNWPIGTMEEWQAIVDTAHAAGKRAVVHISHKRFLEQAAELGVDEIVHMVTEPIDDAICKTLTDKNIYWIPTLELWKGVSEIHNINYDSITLKNLGIWYNAGGKIALGTDFAGYICDFDKGFPITEVSLMKEAGMSNMDIILAGTKNAAECCDREDLGTLEAGKTADLLVVEGAPLVQIEDLGNTYMVVHNGEVAFKK